MFHIVKISTTGSEESDLLDRLCVVCHALHPLEDNSGRKKDITVYDTAWKKKKTHIKNEEIT